MFNFFGSPDFTIFFIFQYIVKSENVNKIYYLYVCLPPFEVFSCSFSSQNNIFMSICRLSQVKLQNFLFLTDTRR